MGCGGGRGTVAAAFAVAGRPAETRFLTTLSSVTPVVKAKRLNHRGHGGTRRKTKKKRHTQERRCLRSVAPRFCDLTPGRLLLLARSIPTRCSSLPRASRPPCGCRCR